MTHFRVISVTKEDNMIRAVQEVTDDVGNVSLNLFLMRDDTVEWRAAEYGFDYDTEFDDVVDFILYEPYFPPGTPLLHDYETQEEAKAGVMAMTQQVMLEMAPPVEVQPLDTKARESIIEEARVDNSFFSAREPMEALREACLFGREEYDIKLAYTRKFFDAKAERKRKIESGEIAPTPTVLGTPRASQLRAILENRELVPKDRRRG